MSDILSLSNADTEMFEFAFSAHYGYGGSLINMASHTSQQLAIVKSLTKSQLR